MPVKADMVKAATELYQKHFPEWQLCSASLATLGNSFPQWDEKSCLIKASAINQLYGTNVFLLVPLARCISEKMLRTETGREGGLVEFLAIHPTTNARHTSFSSKLCHFFINSQKYCIFDGAASEALEYFLGSKYVCDERNRYDAFLKNLQLIRQVSPELRDTNIDNVALDRFLWLFGLWLRLRNNIGINAEATRVFSNPPREIMRRFVPDFEDETNE